MTLTKITPVLLCGGAGTRLWPLSRKSYPKQFALKQGGETLFQASAKRLSGVAGGLSFAKPVLVTGAEFRFIVTEQLSAIGLDPGPILIEPAARNTAPAVLAAVLQQYRQDPEAILLIAPSDHAIPDGDAFCAAVARGLPALALGRMVTFGILPDRPETGYGYLALGDAGPTEGAPTPLRGFVEKPGLAQAQAMLAEGGYLWNAGIFLFRAKNALAAYRRFQPQMCADVEAALDLAREDLGFLRLDPAAWARLEDISIDYAVMERAETLSVMPFAGGWSDLGGWDAVWREGHPDASGLVTAGAVTAIGCDNSLLRSEVEGLELVGIGLSGILAIATPDAVLVADASRAQEVKEAVRLLKAKGAPQAERLPRDHRPWGWYEQLAHGERFQVKRIHVKPGAALSLQSHYHRAEHWVVVEGTAKITIGDRVELVSENQSVYVPLGAKHRLENPGKLPIVLIEVQTGSYLGEDDIVRYEDVYARGEGS